MARHARLLHKVQHRIPIAIDQNRSNALDMPKLEDAGSRRDGSPVESKARRDDLFAWHGR
jgi:hypothetical protein